MNSATMQNTQKYAKAQIAKVVEKQKNVEKLETKQIYVLKKKEDYDENAWLAVLIDSYCQAGKTNKTNETLVTKISATDDNTLVLYVTQANSTKSTTQAMQRAMAFPDMNNIVPKENIYKCSEIPDADDVEDGNYMIVDYWNSRNTTAMLSFVEETEGMFPSIIVVVDECEQGGTKGLENRLSFIRKVEKKAPDSTVKIVFVTATISNLSKSIAEIAKANELKYKKSVINKILNEPVVEHQFAKPHETYVGVSWFERKDEDRNVWWKVEIPKKLPTQTKDQYAALKENIVMESITRLPPAAKELSMIVTSTRTSDHSSIAERLYRSGYNVTVELNGTNKNNFTVKFVNKSSGISTWEIPYGEIDKRADRGDLESYWDKTEEEDVETGIMDSTDYTMSHVLQASLFMRTNQEERIKAHTRDFEFKKLEGISNAIANMRKSLRRPNDYPRNPRVALIAGHLAGRGITIQNPGIDFTCTSFCYTDTKDALQRGATNMQKFGRACGSLGNVFAREGREPILIATHGIMRDALANEMALKEKAELLEDGTMISLKDLVTKFEWEKIMEKIEKRLKDRDNNGGATEKPKVTVKTDKKIGETNVSEANLTGYFKETKNLIVSKIVRYLYNMNGAISFKDLKQGLNFGKKTDAQFQSNLDSGRGVGCKFGKLYEIHGDQIELNPKIREYLDDLNI